MPQLVLSAVDIVMVCVLVFGLYMPRHRRRDLVVAYLGVNIGVLAVADSLGNSKSAAGLGLGLFGILSIIRLRSTEIDQREVAYYFASLALGILGALGGSEPLRNIALMALVLVALLIADHPRLLRGYEHQIVMVDRALSDPRDLAEHLEQVLGAKVYAVSVQRLDLVNDTTMVDVRYRRRKEDAKRDDDPFPKEERLDGQSAGSLMRLAGRR